MGREVLLLEDDLILRKRISAHLGQQGMEVTATETCLEAQRALQEFHFDFALFDLTLPDGNSLELLRDSQVPGNTLCVIMTGAGGISSAVESIRLGASDYLTKPFELDELTLVFVQALSRSRSRRATEHLSEQTKRKSENLFFKGSFIEDLDSLKKVLSADKRLTGNLPPLLIEGPTGSGKSSYARWVHANGPRSNSPFIALNCSAIAENLLESELFGHEKGAFTDAKDARIGLFEAADGGTLFLDEVASLSSSAQAKLLLAIESGKIRRVGGNKEVSVDVRIIAAANQDLRAMIARGEFREDLFHRLDLLRISIPSLSTRTNDLPQLADDLLGDLCRKYQLQKPRLSKASLRWLQLYSWPGNVRELIHELERAIVMYDPGKDLDLPSSLQMAQEERTSFGTTDWLNVKFKFPEMGFSLEEEILRLIRLAIQQANGKVSAAARMLGVKRDYLRYRLKKEKLQKDEK